MDAGTTIALVGAAIQALPPAAAIAQQILRRPNAAELVRALPTTPIPAPDRSLETLLDQAAAALDPDA